MDGIKEKILEYKKTSYHNSKYDGAVDTKQKIEIWDDATDKLSLYKRCWSNKNIDKRSIGRLGIKALSATYNGGKLQFLLNSNRVSYIDETKTLIKDDASERELGKHLFTIYTNKDIAKIESAFNGLRDLGLAYPVVAYYMFLVDKDKYLPLRVNGINKTLEDIGYNRILKSGSDYDYSNYMEYIDIMKEIQEKGEFQTLLEAHSLVWCVKKKTDDGSKKKHSKTKAE